MLHLKIFLENSHQNTVEEALKSMFSWNGEGNNDTENVLNGLFRSVAKRNKDSIWTSLLQYSKLADFRCWRFYLVFLKHIALTCSDGILNDLKGVVKGTSMHIS